MDTASLLGYAASLCLIISLVVSSDLKFRIFNTAGCLCFIIYAIIFQVWPVLITNSILFAINAWYLIKLFGRKEDFTLIEYSPNDELMQKFVALHKDDIQKYFPLFNATQLSGNLNFAVLRDLAVANIFSVKPGANGDVEVAVNYTVKKFRDRKVSRYLLSGGKERLASKGIKRLIYRNMQDESHLQLLRSLGFEEHDNTMVKAI